jgi:hypothetical protein
MDEDVGAAWCGVRSVEDDWIGDDRLPAMGAGDGCRRSLSADDDGYVRNMV